MATFIYEGADDLGLSLVKYTLDSGVDVFLNEQQEQELLDAIQEKNKKQKEADQDYEI